MNVWMLRKLLKFDMILNLEGLLSINGRTFQEKKC